MKGFYGKKNDLAKMARLFALTAKGGSGAVLVSGPAGSGKTALVTRFALDAEKEGAIFCCAKADPLFSNSPFSTLSAALNMLAKKIIAEDPHGRAGMKKALLKSLDPHHNPGFAPLLNLVPSLSHFFGATPEQMGQGETEGQSLNLQLLSLLEAFAALGRPLVLFLDDLQWMDGASHGFLHYLAINGLVPGMMLVTAFRTNEPEKSQFLEQTASLYRSRESTLSLGLSGLTKRDTRGFIRQWLEAGQNLNNLADICHEKTAGNPFYLTQLVDELLEKGTVCRKNGDWLYDLSHISSLGFTDNIIDLIIERMRLLEKDCLVLLKQAACIQNHITAPLLEATSGFPREKIETLLWKPVRINLLQKTEDGYAFVHDRIKETLEGLLRDDDNVPGIHRRIVDFLLADGADMENNVFTLLFHYDVYAHTVTDEHFKKKMAGYYLLAGEQARKRSAYALSLEYFTRGKAHYPGDIWARDYELAIGFCRQMAECAYLAGEFAVADRVFREAEDRARSFSDRLAVEMVKVSSYQAQEKGDQALAAGFAILRHLGIKMPENPSTPRVLYAILKAWARFVFSRKDRLKDKKMIPGTRAFWALKCLNDLGAVAFYISPDKLVPLVAATAFNLTLKHGNMEESPVAYSLFGQILNQITGTVKWGRKLGGLAREISLNFNDDRFKTKEITQLSLSLEHWDKPMSQSIRDLEKGARFCLRQEDHEYFVYNALGSLHCMIISTFSLDLARQKIDENKKIFKRLNNRLALTTAGIMKQGVVNLEQGTARPWILTGDHFDESRLDEVPGGIMTELYYYKFCMAFYCGRTDMAARIREDLDLQPGTALDAYVYHYYQFLSALVDINQDAGSKKTKKHLKKLKKYAAYNQPIYGSKYLLALGDSLRIKGDSGAGAVYRDAAKAARKNAFIFEEALAWECLGKIAWDNGDKAAASKHFTRAVGLYKKWGLKRRYGLFSHKPEPLPSGQAGPGSARTAPRTGSGPPVKSPVDGQDVENILAALKTASKAQAVHLAQKTAQHWKSRVYIDGKGIHRPTTFVPLPEKVLSYACATGEVIQADADSIEEEFLDIDYFWTHHPTSLLVIPGKGVNAVYIENFENTPEMTALIHSAEHALADLEPDPADAVPGPELHPANGVKLKAQCRILQEHMIKEQAFQNHSLTLAGLAKAVGMSQRTVTDAINTCLGQNFATFVNTYRVEAVKQALGDPANKDKTVLEIAYSQGFNSKSTFNNVFKSLVGTTPSKFRAKSDK